MVVDSAVAVVADDNDDATMNMTDECWPTTMRLVVVVVVMTVVRWMMSVCEDVADCWMRVEYW